MKFEDEHEAGWLLTAASEPVTESGKTGRRRDRHCTMEIPLQS